MYAVDFVGPGFADPSFVFFMIFYVLYSFFGSAIAVGTYVLQSLGLYCIAKRRCIRKPWLAWIPMGSDWILGSISDQYRYVTKGKIKNKRKAMLTMSIFSAALVVTFFVGFILFVVQFMAYDGNMFMVFRDFEAQTLGSMSVAVVAWFLLMGLTIALGIFRFMALYDLYRSCEPSNSVLLLVLSILIPITPPIFLFLCRNKDSGMPPRKPELYEE